MASATTEILDKLGRIEAVLEAIRAKLGELEAAGRSPSRVAVDRVADLCLRVNVEGLEIEHDLRRS